MNKKTIITIITIIGTIIGIIVGGWTIFEKIYAPRFIIKQEVSPEIMDELKNGKEVKVTKGIRVEE